MLNNIEDSSKYSCTGCGACTKICPVNAIEYKQNENGFFQGFVNKEKCINCGKCKKICPKFLEKEQFGNELKKCKVYSTQSKNKETIMSCTSGGIAYEISKYGIENGYKIFGTVYDYEENIAKAIIAKDSKEIELLKGSKYIQSNTSKAIEEMINDCMANKDAKYIVFGTPCQITGISKLIEIHNIKNEIIKIDLLCHGVPSYLVWNNYIKWLKDKQKIENIKQINFRSKEYGWHQFCMKVVGEDKEYTELAERSSFYKCFLDNIVLNKACFDCNVRMEYSNADIRLGDFWGKRYIDRHDGISLALLLTNNGKNLLDKLENENKISIMEEIEYGEWSQYQSVNKYKNIELHDVALEELKNSKDIKKMVKKYRKLMNKKYRIKVFCKEMIGILPANIIKKVRVLKHKIVH